MTEIVTSSGFRCEIDEARMNDMELLEALRKMDKGDTLAVVDVLDKVLCEQKTALYDHVRAQNGTVPTEAVMQAITEIFDQLKGDGKK